MAINRMTIDNQTYTAKPFDFDMLCELEGTGVDINNVGKMSMSLIRGYFAVCADISTEEASERIQKHIVSGGKLDDISEAMSKEMDKSDFFRALSSNQQKNKTENHTESKKTSEKDDTVQ